MLNTFHLISSWDEQALLCVLVGGNGQSVSETSPLDQVTASQGTQKFGDFSRGSVSVKLAVVESN